MEATFRAYATTNWTTIALVFSLLLLSVARLLKPQQFLNFMMLLTSDKYLIIEQKQNKLSFSFHTALHLFQVISLGLFLYLLVSYLYSESYTENAILLLQVMTGYLLFVMSKYLIEKIIGVLISSESLINHYLFCKISYRNYLSIIFLPVNIVLLYAITPSTILLVIFSMLLLVGNLLTLFVIFKNHRSFIYENIFYFILYLCTLEIAPYFILYKLFEG